MDCKILFTLPLLLSTAVFNVNGTETCVAEKQTVDHWNSLLRQSATEQRRTRHREAKALFLKCLGESDKKYAQARQNQTSSSNSRNASRQRTNHSAVITRPGRKPIPNRTYTRDVVVSSYHGFTGAKRLAWEGYYQDPVACINNSGNMSRFVTCSAQRKKSLERFNALWNDSTQSLDSPLN